jgi:hypothetical protein
MASKALPTKKGRGIEKYLPWHQNLPIKCRHFPTKTRGAVFPLIPGIFTHQYSRKFFFTFYDVQKHVVRRKKNLSTTDGIFIDRDALFSWDNLFPINFFAVYVLIHKCCTFHIFLLLQQMASYGRYLV